MTFRSITLTRDGKPVMAGELRPGEVIEFDVFTGELEPRRNRAMRRAAQSGLPVKIRR